MGPGAHVVAVCQPCVPALAAAAIMAEDDHPAAPHSLTLMAGPIDARVSPTMVNDLAAAPADRVVRAQRHRDRPAALRRRRAPRVPGLRPGRGVHAHEPRPPPRRVPPPLRRHRRRQRRAGARDEGLLRRVLRRARPHRRVLPRDRRDDLPRPPARARRASSGAAGASTPARSGARRCSPSRASATTSAAWGRPPPPTTSAPACRPPAAASTCRPGAGHFGVFSGSRWELEVYPELRSHILMAR